MFTDFSTAFGFFIAIVLMAGIREKIEYNDIPKTFRGTAIVLITACLMSIAFMGFSGMILGGKRRMITGIIVAAVVVGCVGIILGFFPWNRRRKVQGRD